VAALIENHFDQALLLRRLQEQVTQLSRRVEQLEVVAAPLKSATIQSFAPEAYEVLKPIPVEIEADGDSFVATFRDASISTSGDTEQEAFENLKSLILDIFDSLRREPDENLGPVPRRQLAVLRDVIRVE
jgi:predicted RNase H-like HicB family nuclease